MLQKVEADITKRRKTETLSVRIPLAAKRKVYELAESNGLPMSDVVYYAIYVLHHWLNGTLEPFEDDANPKQTERTFADLME